jgi:hypothetical protein
MMVVRIMALAFHVLHRLIIVSTRAILVRWQVRDSLLHVNVLALQ